MELTLENDPAARILDTPVRDLKPTIAGSPVERLTKRLVREMRSMGIRRWTPEFYLTDEWGCPSGEPVIGIPFYLADRTLMRFERRMNDLESPREIMMYLRHEAGHAFNYAYRPTRRRNGVIRSAHSAAATGKITSRFRSAGRSCATSRGGTRETSGRGFRRNVLGVDADAGLEEAVRELARAREARVRGARRDGVGRQGPPRAEGRTDLTVDEMDQTVRQVFEEMSARNRAALS